MRQNHRIHVASEASEIFALGLPTRGQTLDCCKQQRGLTANKRFALLGSMNREIHQRSKPRGMDPVAIQNTFCHARDYSFQ